MVTFPAARLHRPLAGTKLCCLVTEARVLTTCPGLCQDLNPRLTDCKSSVLTARPPSHTHPLWYHTIWHVTVRSWLATVAGVLLVGVVFALDHVRQHIAVAPPTTAKLLPLIVVIATAADECQVVDARRATQTSASRVRQLLFTTYTHTHWMVPWKNRMFHYY